MVVVEIDGNAKRNILLRPPFGRRVIASVYGNHFVIADGGSGEISVFSRDGAQMSKLAPPWQLRQVTPRDVKRFVDSIEHPVAQRRTIAALDVARVPDTQPILSDMRIDNSGDIWVSDYDFDNDSCATWLKLTGDQQHPTRLPRAFSVLDIIGDRALVATQALPSGEEHVLIVSMHPEGGTAGAQ